MAKTTEDNTELDELAFRLYAERISKMPTGAGGEAASGWAYRKAEEFLSVRARVRSGQPTAIYESKLSDVSAPNLRPTHPHNLVSQRFCEPNGGEQKVLARIKQILDWLNKNPRSDTAPVALDQIDRFDPATRLDWDVPTTNLARVLLPHYVST